MSIVYSTVQYSTVQWKVSGMKRLTGGIKCVLDLWHAVFKISKVWASSGLLSPTMTKIDNNYLLCKQCAI